MARERNEGNQKMKIAALQLDIEWENRSANFARVGQFAEESAKEGVDLLILPEMFSTGFSMNPRVTAEDSNGKTACFLRDLAKRHSMAIVGGLVLKGSSDKGRNAALVVARSGDDIATYTKTHLFSFMGEDRYHEPGTGPVVFDYEGMSCACFICYDLRFPNIFQAVAQQCQIFLVIASWPAARQEQWDVLLRARAIENQCYVVGVNRVGTGDGLPYSGGSAIIDPLGNVIKTQKESEALLISEINPTLVHEVREAMPFLKDSRAAFNPQ
jgi:predicted amidohydrolase